MIRKRKYYRTKIHLNVWREPMPILKSEDYLSPHCASENCTWCKERRRRAFAAANPPAIPPPVDYFWDRKITRGQQEPLGPSAPDRWLTTFVKNPAGIDALGYWPQGSTMGLYIKES